MPARELGKVMLAAAKALARAASAATKPARDAAVRSGPTATVSAGMPSGMGTAALLVLVLMLLLLPSADCVVAVVAQ
eukprot:8886-Heterococcus_DN1.PRE.1